VITAGSLLRISTLRAHPGISNASGHKMALPLAPGLTPNEEGFLAEMELVTVIPRQKLKRLELLGVSPFLAVS
jgi:hypothetical protein